MHSRRLCWIPALILLASSGSAPVRAETSAGTTALSTSQPPRVYARLYDPREHPDYQRRHTQPPSWETFDHRTRFTCLRGFTVKDGQIVDYEKELDRFTRKHKLGDVIWPSYPIVFAKNLRALAEEIKKRDLFLFDIWGYVPGSGPGGYWQQFTPPPGVFEMLEETLGERWLGMDIGEQDGRYVGSYASQMTPSGAGRFEQHLNFQRHFERMGNDLGNRLATLVSLNFGHYFLKEGVYTLIGAETAQALPNSQVYYAFIRGAGKQYGVPWFGNASIFNRWGWKVYGVEEKPGHGPGPTKGTSLNLLKRLLYSHIFYNCVAAGFENGWLLEDKLTPIGRIQQSAKKWLEEHGSPGVMLTPVALLLDFRSGWSFPRHLYTGHVYRVWGNLPYEPGDYLTDGVLGMLYPRYQDSSYFHDETGFLSVTPYGDIADCLLSDAPSWLLGRYATVVVAGELRGGREIRDKLERYIRDGGQVVITAGSLACLPSGLCGVAATSHREQFPEGSTVTLRSKSHRESMPFELTRLQLPSEAEVVGRCGELPAIVCIRSGTGSLCVLASPFGVGARSSVQGGIPNPIDKPLPQPYPLLSHVRAALDQLFTRNRLFTAGPNLSVISCRKAPKRYTLCVGNNSLKPVALRIESHCGEIESLTELPLDQSEKGAVGYLPKGFEGVAIGKSDAKTIAGGDVRVFSVTLREERIREIPHRNPLPRPQGRYLTLRNVVSVKREILARPTFFAHFDGVMLDWRYLYEREKAALQAEAGWIQRQGLHVVVDLSSGINLYPGLRLIDNIKADYETSMAVIRDVLAKTTILGGRDIVLSLHRFPENNFTRQQTWDAFDRSLKTICAEAAARQCRIHLRIVPGKPPGSAGEALRFLKRVGAENLCLAPSVGLLAAKGNPERAEVQSLEKKIGLWMLGGPGRDVAGHLWSVTRPLAKSPALPEVVRVVRTAPKVPLVFDAVYAGTDAEYREAIAVHDALSDGHP